MSINIGGIDLTEALINAELRIGTLEKIVQHLVGRLPQDSLRQEDVARYRDQTLAELQNKYPQAGIEPKKS